MLVGITRLFLIGRVGMLRKLGVLYLSLITSCSAFADPCYMGTVELRLENNSLYDWTFNRQASSTISGNPPPVVPAGQTLTGTFGVTYGHGYAYDFVYENDSGGEVIFETIAAQYGANPHVISGEQYAVEDTNASGGVCYEVIVNAYKFLPPPKQRVEINVGFQSNHHANIASMSIQELFDAKLLENLDIANGKPFDISVHDNIVKMIFKKVCTIDSCGY